MSFRRALSVSAILSLLGWSGCTERPDPLEVERWVIAAPERFARGVGHRDRCEIGTELRPAVGCPHLVIVSPVGEGSATPRGLSQRYRAPARAFRTPVVFKRAYRPKSGGPWTPLPPLVVSALTPEIEIEFPIADASGGPFDVTASAYVLPPAARTIETEAVRIAPDSLLDGGLGLDPLSLGAGAPPVRFRIIAAAIAATAPSSTRPSTRRARAPSPGSTTASTSPTWPARRFASS
jgi:hypothetical protein